MKIIQQPQIINKTNYQTNVNFKGFGLSKLFGSSSHEALTLSPQAQLNKDALNWLKSKCKEYGNAAIQDAYNATLNSDNNVYEPALNILKKFLPDKKPKLSNWFNKTNQNDAITMLGLPFLYNMLLASKNSFKNHTEENIKFLNAVLEKFRSYKPTDYLDVVVNSKDENGNVIKGGKLLFDYFVKNDIVHRFSDFMVNLSHIPKDEQDFVTKNYTKIKNNHELFSLLNLSQGKDSKEIIKSLKTDIENLDIDTIKLCLSNAKTKRNEASLDNYAKLKTIYKDNKKILDYIEDIKNSEGKIVDENINFCDFLTKLIKDTYSIKNYIKASKDKNGIVNSEFSENLKKILKENSHPESHSNIIYCINNLKNNKGEVQWDFVNIFSALKNHTDKNSKAVKLKYNTFDKILALSKDDDGNIIKTLIPEFPNLIKNDLLLEMPNIFKLSKKGNDFDNNNFEKVFNILNNTISEDKYEMSEFLLACQDKNGNLDNTKISTLNEIQKRGIKSNIIKLANSLINPDNSISKRALDLAEHLRKNSHHLIEEDLPLIIDYCRDKSGFLNNKTINTVKNLQNLKQQIQLSELLGIILNSNKEIDDNKLKVVINILKEITVKDSYTIKKIISAAQDKYGVIDLEVLKLVTNLSKKDKDISRYMDVLPAYRNLYKYEHVTSLSQLNLRQKRTLMRCLKRYKSDIESPRFREILNPKIFPNNESEYCSILARLSHSIGTNVQPLSKTRKENLYKALNSLSDTNKEFMNIDFDNDTPILELTYSLNDFKNDVWNIVKRSHYSDRTKALDYFGFELKENNNILELTGFPSADKPDGRLAQIKDKEVLSLIQKLTPLIIKFTQNNDIVIQNKPQLSKDLTDIIKAFPEFLTTIKKEQHEFHDFTLDIHCLKVLQEVMKNKEFAKLSASSKKHLQLSALFHDLTKAEKQNDRQHPENSGFDTYYLLDKLGLKEKDKLKIYNIIKYHSWLAYYDFTNHSAKRVAFNMREGDSFKMLMMLTEGDLKGVKKHDAFYLKHAKQLEKAKKEIAPYLYDLKRTNINLPQTKIPKASELNRHSNYVNVIQKDGITNTVLTLKKGIDLQKVGFKTCKSLDDFNVLVHALDSKDSASMFQALGMIDSNALLSTSYISYAKGNYRAYRSEGFILDVPAINIHAAYWRDFGSGYKKTIQRDLFGTYLFQNNPQREYMSSKLKKELHLNDKEYINLFPKIEDIPIEKLEAISTKTAKAYRKIFNDMEVSRRSNNRNYNEVLVTSPKIQAIFCYDKKPENISSYLRRYAEKHNVPIIVFE